MRALTITQPWLWCITDLGKRVENRRYGTDYRGPLALHASANPDRAMLLRMRAEGWDIPPEVVAVGAVAAVCDLVDVHPVDSPRCRCGHWADHGPRVHHWVLADVEPLSVPVACRGARRLWTPDTSITERICNDQ
jgi:hypothetical protein